MKIIHLISLISSILSASGAVSFSKAPETVEAFDYLELSVQVDKPDVRNPFLDASLTGS